MPKVFNPDSALLQEHGFSRLTHVPVLFDDDGSYMREQSRYLRARATRTFCPKPHIGDFPRHETLKAIAYHLADFERWAKIVDADWRSATYDTVIAYQNDLLHGRCSASGKPLDPKTANALADDATFFLDWASLNGLRPLFSYDTRTSERWVSGKLRVSVVRVGRAREYSTIDDSYNFPTPNEVKLWLDAVRLKRGEAKWLACRFVLETGARKKEVEQLRMTDWPTEKEISDALSANSPTVFMILRHGTKGGKPRQIRLPVTFAILVQKWMMTRRKTYAYRLNRRTGNLTNRLFLSDSGEHAGTPLSGNTIWRCFHEVDPRPVRWTTHRGRHAYAVFLILNALESESLASGTKLQFQSVHWINDRGKHWLSMLRKQFGHASEETTEMYLRWLITTTGIAELSMGWHRFLNGEVQDA
jgi:integrase